MRIIPEFPISLSEISEALGLNNKKFGGDFIKAICTDSRETEANDLFIALNGEIESGENFIEDARRKGAYTLSEKDMSSDFKVESTEQALLDITAFYKSKFKGLRLTIAITGSVGKTTTKNIVSSMLCEKFKVHKTHENYNNFLGVAHTVLTMPRDTEILVAELGMNHRGEISSLSKAVKPDISVITNIGSAHLGNLGSREGIAKAKLEITDGMKNKTIITPYGESLLNSPAERITFSTEDENADCYIQLTKEDSTSSLVNINTMRYDLKSLKISIPGKHILNSVAIAVLLLDILKIDAESVCKAIQKLTPECLRTRLIKRGNLTFYDDTYSSSPEAVLAIFNLLSLYKPKKISCVLGDMLELGENTKPLHLRIGSAVFDSGFDKLFTFGTSAEYIADGALSAGMNKEKIYRNKNLSAPEITAAQIASSCDEDEIILCKASHSVHAERIYDCIEKERNRNA